MQQGLYLQLPLHAAAKSFEKKQRENSVVRARTFLVCRPSVLCLTLVPEKRKCVEKQRKSRKLSFLIACPFPCPLLKSKETEPSAKSRDNGSRSNHKIRAWNPNIHCLD
jgi:hypothetical protein